VALKPSDLKDTSADAKRAAVERARELEQEIDDLLRETRINGGMYQIHVKGREILDNPFVLAELGLLYGNHWRIHPVGPCDLECRDGHGDVERDDKGDPVLEPATQLYFIPLP